MIRSNHHSGRLTTFIRKQGFYIALALCIVAVGVVTFLAVGNSESISEQSEVDVQKQEAPNLEQEMSRYSPSPTVTASPTPTASPTATPSATPTKAPVVQQANQSTLTMPLEGEIIKAFSGDTLVYNATLNMWMTHNGVDISAAKDAKVKAAIAGEVKSVETDESKGMVITISHSNQRETVYVGLAEAAVEEGAKVNAGQEIGTAGIPGFESGEGAHLHFEYKVDGKYVDPAENFKEAE